MPCETSSVCRVPAPNACLSVRLRLCFTNSPSSGLNHLTFSLPNVSDDLTLNDLNLPAGTVTTS